MITVFDLFIYHLFCHYIPILFWETSIIFRKCCFQLLIYDRLFPIAYSLCMLASYIFLFPAILLLYVDFIGKTALLVSVLRSTVADVVGMLIDVKHLHLHLTV